MSKKVILIWPYAKNKDASTPLWALSIGAYLKKRIPDIEIHILDEQIISSDLITKRIYQIKPDVVGISISHNYYKSALVFARNAKLVESRVVFGGVYATAMAKEIILK